MESTVNILWTILLIVTVLVLPYLIYLLHTTWKAAKSIERYFTEMKIAGIGISNNTEHIKALDATIEVASGMLEVAGDINSHAETIANTLNSRTNK
ncbi:MAG: hypothetical protein H0X63_10475 [Flavobacteriales bacterium]|nr:hypothetical protein [Flavobacteriales bacterium]